jgi:FkbM family methyltransferase
VELLFNALTKILRVLWISEYRAAFLRNHVAASTEHDGMLGGLNLDTVVDIGANRGQFALCIRRLYPMVEIHSFEPLARAGAKYRAIFHADQRAHLYAAAIASQSGKASMHVARWDVSSSLLPFAKAQQDNFSFSEETGREEVRTAPLSEFLDASHLAGRALLKLDVQGFERAALEGCESLLRHFHFVYVEASFVELYVGQALAADVIQYLHSKGFRLDCVGNTSKGRSKRPIQADFLFSRF